MLVPSDSPITALGIPSGVVASLPTALVAAPFTRSLEHVVRPQSLERGAQFSSRGSSRNPVQRSLPGFAAWRRRSALLHPDVGRLDLEQAPRTSGQQQAPSPAGLSVKRRP